MCCLSVHVDTSDSICVCVQLVVYYICVCVPGIKPYLFTERVCLAIASWLPFSWQTDTQLQFVYCFRTVEIVGTWKSLGPAGVWFMRRVCLISIINDNTAEGRKTHLLLELGALKSRLKRTMVEGRWAFSLLHSQVPLVCRTEQVHSTEAGDEEWDISNSLNLIKINLKRDLHYCFLLCSVKSYRLWVTPLVFKGVISEHVWADFLFAFPGTILASAGPYWLSTYWFRRERL